MNYRTAFLPLALALTIASPAKAEEGPSSIFIKNRTATVCLVELGLATVKDAVEWETNQNLKEGLSNHQIQVFNEQSSDDGWVIESVRELIAENGGCKKLYSEAMQEQSAPKPQPEVLPAYLY